MRAYKCEICGSYYDKPKVMKFKSIDGNRSFECCLSTLGGTYIDVCPDCAKAVGQTIDIRREIGKKADSDNG